MKGNKNLIILLIVLAILVGGYYGAYRPIVGKGQRLESEINDLNSQIAALEPDYLKMAEIQEEIASIEEVNTKKLAKYPAKLSEEFGFRLLFDIEKMSGVEFKDVAFGNVELISSGNVAPAPSAEEGSAEGGESTPAPEPENSYSQSINTRTVTDYEGLKEILKFIYKYPNLTVIENLNVTDISGTTDLAMDMQLQMIGISSSPNDKMPEFDKVERGKDVFFDLVYGEELDPEKADLGKKFREERKKNEGKSPSSKKKGPKEGFADIFLDVHAVTADSEAQSLGMVTVNPSSSVIKSDVNGQMSVDIIIENYGEDLVATYYMNGEERSEIFPMGEVLEMAVYSSERTGEEDYSSVIVNIENITTNKLYINLADEDENNPRIIFNNITGDYEIR